MTPFILCAVFLIHIRYSFAVDDLKKCDSNTLDGSCDEDDIYPTLSGIQTTVEIVHRLQGLNSNPSEVNNKNNSTSFALCPPYDTCANRCGNVHKGSTHTCNCDEQCSYYGDCCEDYQKECVVNRMQDLQHVNYRTKSKCYPFLETFPIFMVSECSKDWKDSFYKSQCDNGVDMPSKCKNEDCEVTYYPICYKRLAAFCNLSGNSRCPDLVSSECKRVAASTCRKCNKQYWPVIGADQILYKNSYCAVCNYQQNYTTLSLKEFVDEIKSENQTKSYPIRKCFDKVIDSCDGNSVFSHWCSNYSDPVCGPKINGKRKFYKNIYCAYCHNESINEMRCASPFLIDSMSNDKKEGKVRPNLLGHITKEGDGIRLDDMPSAFSMLLNFGLDGRQRVFISSEADAEMKLHQKFCGQGKIWDPFSKICRKLHCSTEFVLVDYKCVKKETGSDDVLPDNETIPVPDPKAQFVHLTLSAEIELIDFLQFHNLNLEQISENIRESFSRSFNISSDRIKNVRFNISFGQFESKQEALLYLKEIDDESHPITFTIDLDLYESSSKIEPEPSVDSIVSILASAVSSNGFEFGLNNITGRIYEMQQSVEFLKSWCKESEGGQKKTYWNSEFKLILDDNDTLSVENRIKGLYINKTDKFYPKGRFVADILYQGYQHNRNLINVSGLAIVCDWKKRLNPSCVRIILEKHEYNISDNGSLVILSKNPGKEAIDSTAYEKGENGTVMVCFLKPSGFFGVRFDTNTDFTQAFISYILTWVSIAAMVVVLATYSFFSSLRNLPGCNTMNLTFSLLAMQVTYIFGQRSSVTGKACKAVAIILHYEILCCFMWMNIMAYDLFKTFGAKTILHNIRSKRKYLPRYMLYSYGIPSLIILATSLLDNFLEESDFSPHYGDENTCWITSKTAAVTYFATPLALIMLVNSGFFVLTILSVRNVKHVIHLSQQRSKQCGKRDVFLYAKMGFVIGLTWALAFAAAYVREEKLTGKILTYLFIIFNTLQGLFIFFVFVCNKRVYALYSGSLRKVFKFFSANSGSGKTPKTFANIANVICRSVSTDTVISTVSNLSQSSNDSGLGMIKEVPDPMNHE